MLLQDRKGISFPIADWVFTILTLSKSMRYWPKWEEVYQIRWTSELIGILDYRDACFLLVLYSKLGWGENPWCDIERSMGALASTTGTLKTFLSTAVNKVHQLLPKYPSKWCAPGTMPLRDIPASWLLGGKSGWAIPSESALQFCAKSQ